VFDASKIHFHAADTDAGNEALNVLSRQYGQLSPEKADVIVFDTPPVLAVSDATVLANRVDGVIFVIKAKQTRRDAAKEAYKRLQQGKATVLGCVFNQASGKEGGYYYTYYAQTGDAAKSTVRSKLRHLWRRLPLVRG
jgi:Mrp family chromosome partitioning ATPase